MTNNPEIPVLPEDIKNSITVCFQIIAESYSNPDKIKAWLSQGISAPKILKDLDTNVSLFPEAFGDKPVHTSFFLKQLGAVDGHSR